MTQSLHLIAIVSLVAGGICALLIALDLRRRPPHMWIMSLVWPLCALFGSVLVLIAYLTTGRAVKPGPGMAQGHTHEHHDHHGHHEHHGHAHGHMPAHSFPVSVMHGTLHCGSGCTLGDLLAETLAALIPALPLLFGYPWLFGDQIFAVWILDFLLAFGFGIAFQYFAIKPMRDITVRQALVDALKADAASLIAWQVGMYGFMAVAHFWLFPQVLGQPLTPLSAEFWFAMQIAMLCGFVTSYPMNWALLRAGVKEPM
ncbi:DUF4396 domain-containing protein [Pseudooceanicola sp. CBS1P-1]|uniref:DUF4396 domain-containing protein n=1 Tax=Pseudooceanicola albus TaxID=2692189 RepID=A0A6L7GCR0_9RHOB|nr:MULTISPECIES: DUF4396 domain-containing protein [Pseudooceanicola]MBT9386550.1 DUF4396 domain-containing protein [Pseudooceanicola endophyticus]MXN20583.1 DUF4396 domain-containing protein [Pseudooceanicola albus]